jgi:hypothetical protein
MREVRITQQLARRIRIGAVNHETALHHSDATVHDARVLVEFDDGDVFGL